MSNPDLLSEILEKMIESQIQNTEALTSLKFTMEENNRSTKEISSHFHNGFRSEIKSHITQELKEQLETEKMIVQTLKEIKDKVESFKSIGFWSKVIVGFIGSISVVAAAVIKLLEIVKP